MLLELQAENYAVIDQPPVPLEYPLAMGVLSQSQEQR